MQENNLFTQKNSLFFQKTLDFCEKTRIICFVRVMNKCVRSFMQENLIRVISAYEALESELRANIINGNLKPNSKLSSEEQLAISYKISRGSVRTALNNLVKEGLLNKIHGSGTFVNDVKTETNKSKNAKQILFLSFATALSREAFFERGTYMPMMTGINQGCKTHNLNLLVAHVEHEDDVPSCLLNSNIDGIIFHGVPYPKFYERWMASIPNVSVMYVHPEPNGFCVKTDNIMFGVMAVQKLKEAGCKRIGFVTDEIESMISIERFCGFEIGLMQSKESYNREYCATWQRPSVNGVLQVEYYMPDFKPQLQALFNGENPPPDGLVCIDDWRAFHTIEALKSWGIRVPEDVSVIGSHHKDARAYITKDISSFDVSLEKCCLNAVWLLVKIMNKEITDGSVMSICPKYIEGQTIK